MSIWEENLSPNSSTLTNVQNHILSWKLEVLRPELNAIATIKLYSSKP